MKHIKLEVLKRTTKKVAFRIAEQSHRGREFGAPKDLFKASNGVELSSVGFPEVLPLNNGDLLFFVRGLKQDEDRKKLNTTCEAFALIEEAVAEYNEHFRDQKPKDPARGQDTPEIQVFKACVSYPHAAGGYQVVELLVVGAETEEEARRLVKEAVTTSTCQIESIPKTTAKEKGILHRSVMTVI